MSTDPSVAVHDALISAIRGLGTAAGLRVFGQVQLEKPAYPYVMVWPSTLTPIDEECFDRSEQSSQVDIYADTEAYITVKEIAGLIRMALHETSIPIAGHTLDRMRVDSISYSQTPPVYRAMIILSIETQPA